MKKEELISNLNYTLDFLRHNDPVIDWVKIEKDIGQLTSNLKNCIIPTDNIVRIFTNKRIFPSLNEIKTFINTLFNVKLTGSSTKEILSQISYYCIIEPDFLRKIETKINSIVLEIKVPPKKKPAAQKKKEVIDESWDDWTKYPPNELKKHLNDFTVPQIKTISGKILSPSEKKFRKAELIDLIVNKIEKLKAKYEMGPR